VAGIVGRYGIDGLFMCTMMAGVFLLILGITGSGTAVKFIPRPIEEVLGEFLHRMEAVIENFTRSRFPRRCWRRRRWR
jgi:hypothetical protein